MPFVRHLHIWRPIFCKPRPAKSTLKGTSPMSEPFTLSVAIRKFLHWAERQLAPGTVADYCRHLQRFEKAVGDLPVAELRAHHLVSWGKTWHNIVAVQRCFNWL